MLKLPDAKLLVYHLNSSSGYYELTTAPPAFKKLPPELRLEETQKTEQIKSKYIIRGRIEKGEYTFFTGIIPTGYPQYYFGDHYQVIKGKKKNSFVLFHLSTDNQVLTVHYFNSYKLYPAKRNLFVKTYLQSIKKGSDFPTPFSCSKS